jgi:predicted alpha/beta-fold hydrolase
MNTDQQSTGGKDDAAVLTSVEAATGGVSWLDPYKPWNRLMRNAHLQTLAGNYMPRRHELSEPTEELVEVAAAKDGMAATYVLCHCHWQPEEVRAERLTVVLVHGVEGSSGSHYILGNATKAWRVGCNVVRMNMRNCGGTEHLGPTLYHCGLSGDVRAVVEHCVESQGVKAVAAVGYSMGGNLVLRYVGEEGDAVPEYLKAVGAVSPAIDISQCSTALHTWPNRGYEWSFLRGLVRRFQRKAQLFPELYDPAAAKGLRSMRDFDDRVVARYAGFKDGEDYYQQTSAARVVEKIRVPTLIIHAMDDPFIRITEPTRAKLVANPQIRLVETPHGGHCAFLTLEKDGDEEGQWDRYWAERTLLRFLLSAAGARGGYRAHAVAGKETAAL